MRRLFGGMALLIVAIVAFSWAVADDKEIAREITERLKQEQDSGKLHDFDINLKVAEGHVLLQGHVCSTEQQALALDIARSTGGVKRVVNDLLVASEAEKPKPAQAVEIVQGRDDRLMATEIAAKLREHKEAGLLKGFRIDIDVKDGKAMLDGRVADAEQLDLVLATVENIQGVKSVVNRLSVATADASTDSKPLVASASARKTIEPAKASPISDQEIAGQIAASLRRLKEMGTLTGFNIDLAVENGVVMLTGHVSSEEQQQLALDIAENAKGVQDVVNHLTITQADSAPLTDTTEGTPVQPVSYTPTPADAPVAEQAAVPDDFRIGEELTTKLRQAKQQGILQSFGIGVHVERGTVWLKGRVSSPEQQQLALEMARRVDGVRQVVNELTVEAVAAPQVVAPSSEEIAQEIRERLDAAQQQGTFLGSAFDVKVEGNDVWLTGEVASAEQEQRAVAIASQVNGVSKVLNALTIAAPAMAPALPTRVAMPQAAEPTAQLASLQMPRSNGPSAPAVSAEAELPVMPATIDAGPTATTPVQPQVSAPARMSVAMPTDASFQSDSSVAMQSIREATAIPATSLTSAPAPVAPLATASRSAEVVRVPTAQPVVYPQMTTYPAMAASNNQPLPIGAMPRMAYAGAAVLGAPIMAVNHLVGGSPASLPGAGQAVVPARYDHPNLPGYAWPSYAAYPNYAAVTYPKQYSPTAWPYIGPFYPYPQVPLGWRKVTLKWDDGWWQLNFCSK